MTEQQTCQLGGSAMTSEPTGGDAGSEVWRLKLIGEPPLDTWLSIDELVASGAAVIERPNDGDAELRCEDCGWPDTIDGLSHDAWHGHRFAPAPSGDAELRERVRGILLGPAPKPIIDAILALIGEREKLAAAKSAWEVLDAHWKASHSGDEPLAALIEEQREQAVAEVIHERDHDSEFVRGCVLCDAERTDD